MIQRGAKTEAIRELLTGHPDWDAKKICAEVNRQGIHVSIQMVYKVIKAVQSFRSAEAESDPVSIQSLNLQELMDFKIRVVDHYGGVARVEALIAALKMLQSPEPQTPSVDDEKEPRQKPMQPRSVGDSWEVSMDRKEP